MLPIVSQMVSNGEVYIKFSNGNEVTITPKDLQDEFLSVGLDKKHGAIRSHVKSKIEKALGEIIPDEWLKFDTDDDGNILNLGIGRGDT